MTSSDLSVLWCLMTELWTFFGRECCYESWDKSYILYVCYTTLSIKCYELVWKGKVRTDLFLSKLSSLRPNKNGYSVNSRPQPLRLLLSSTYRKLTIKNLFMIVFPILFSEKLRNIGLFYTTRNISSSISTVALHWLNI